MRITPVVQAGTSPEMLRALLGQQDLAGFLAYADSAMPEALSAAAAMVYDEVGAEWAEKLLASGEHFAAVMIVSASCTPETILEIANRCLEAHPGADDPTRQLINRELAGLAHFISDDADEGGIAGQ